MKEAGMTIEAIAAKVGTSARPVLARLKAAGMTKVDMYSADDLDQMKRMHEGGSSIPEIHAAIGKGTEQAVRYRLHTMGCTTKKVMPWTRHPQTEAILNLHEQGMTGVQIGQQLGITSNMACKVLRMEGITLRGGAAIKLTPELIALAADELSKGRTLKAVADELGVSGTLVRLRVKEYIEQSKQQ